MKKSKFLKKSLAMLLAVMLVVAMIPLSAAAAEGVTVNVNGKPATSNGTEYTAEASGYTVAISATVPDGSSFVLYDKDNATIAATGSVNLKTQAKDEGNDVYSLTFRVNPTTSDSDAPAELCTLKITVKEAALNGDATIKAVKDIDNMSSYEIADNTITIWYDFGKEIVAPTAANFVTTATTPGDATVQSPSISGNKGTVKVNAKDGSSKTYNVELKSNPGFETFTVNGQVGDSVITANGNVTNTVTANVAFGTDLEKIVPTFTLGDTITKVTVQKNGEDVEVKSGETEVNFKTNSTVTFKLYVGENDKTGVPVNVTLTAKDNTEAVLKTIKVGDSNEVEIAEGATTATVEMPADFDFTSVAADSVTVSGTASENAGVSIPAQSGKTSTATGGKYSIPSVDVSGEYFIIRVKADQGDAYTDYRITLTKAAKDQALLGDVSAKTKVNGEEVVYTATWSGNEGTLKLPYSAKDDAKLADYTLLNPNHSTGANVTPALAGQTLASVFGTNESITVTVTNGDVKSTYTIKLDYETPKYNRDVTSAEVTSTNKVSAMDSDNTYSVSVGTATNKADDKTVKTLKVNVPFSFDASKPVYFSDLTLSEGAKIYKQDGTEIKALDMDGYGEQAAATGLTLNADEGIDTTTGKLDTSKAVPVYVLSESKWVGATIDASYLTNNATQYWVYIDRAPAMTGRTLNTLSGSLEYNNKTYEVTGAVSSGKVKVTVPATMPKDGTAATVFYFDYTASSQATVKAVYSGGSVELPKDYTAGKTDKGAIAYDGKLKVFDGSIWQEITSIDVTNERGDDTTKYTLELEVAKAETGALLTSAKVNNTTASIDNIAETVTVNLPFGTKLTMANLTLEASKMATIAINTTANIYDPDKIYDISGDFKIIVTAEDGKTQKVYNLKVTTADQFSDVDTNDWYYSNVMRAVELGILSGYTDGTFKPMNNITRRDFAIMLAQSLGHDNDEEATSPFKDVADTDYGVSSIAYLYENEITVGDSNGNFNPDANITRQEAAIMLVKAFEATGTSSDLYADDAQIASWAKSFVYTAKAAGLMKGDDHNEFNPTDRLTRAEAASAMVNAVDN